MDKALLISRQGSLRRYIIYLTTTEYLTSPSAGNRRALASDHQIVVSRQAIYGGRNKASLLGMRILLRTSTVSLWNGRGLEA